MAAAVEQRRKAMAAVAEQEARLRELHDLQAQLRSRIAEIEAQEAEEEAAEAAAADGEAREEEGMDETEVRVTTAQRNRRVPRLLSIKT